MELISPETASTLIEWRQYLVPLHLFGVAMGLGSVIATDVLFMRALKDKRVSDDEVYLLKGLSLIIWSGLVVLAVSGTLLALPQFNALLYNPAFLGKETGVLILLINGLVLNLVVTPALTQINFAGSQQASPAIARAKTLAFTLGGVSTASWYSVFILAFIMKSGSEWLLIRPLYTYAAALVGLIIIVMIGGYTFTKIQR